MVIARAASQAMRWSSRVVSIVVLIASWCGDALLLTGVGLVYLRSEVDAVNARMRALDAHDDAVGQTGRELARVREPARVHALLPAAGRGDEAHAPILDLDHAVAQRSVHLDAAGCVERQLDLGLAAGGDAHADGSARFAPIVRIQQRQQQQRAGEDQPVGARDHGSPITTRGAGSISKCMRFALAGVIYTVRSLATSIAYFNCMPRTTSRQPCGPATISAVAAPPPTPPPG